MHERRSWKAYGPRQLSAVMVLVGILLVVSAFIQASVIPLRAHGDYGALIVALGGSISTTEGYPSVYRQMSANRRMLQNAYLGVGGLVLLSAGCFGLARAHPVPVLEPPDAPIV